MESRLPDWYRKASVRTRPERVLRDESEQGKLFFSPDYAPLCAHPQVVERGPEIVQRVLVQRLYGYLGFVALIEHEVVNRTTNRLAQRRIGLPLPDPVVLDAFKILTDEAFHAQFSAELKVAVEQATGIKAGPIGTPRCLHMVSTLLSGIPRELHNLGHLFFTIVSETLIATTGVLGNVPQDERVMTTVRELIADHAEDEGRHNHYFGRVAEFLWPQLSEPQRRVLGPLLPRFIFAWLEPDHSALAAQLAGCGFSIGETTEMIHHVYRDGRAGAIAGARATVRLFERIGVLQDGFSHDAFAASGLL